MDLFARVTDLEKTVHRALANAIGDCDAALQELDDGKREWPVPKASVAPAPKRGAKAVEEKQQTRLTNARSTKRLHESWDALKPVLEAHIARETEDVFPMCELVVAGVGREDDLRALVKEMLADHEQLKRLLATVRVEVGAVEPVRSEFLQMASLVDEHFHKTEGLIFPEALGQLQEEVSVMVALKNRQASADSISKSLRRSRPAPEPEPEPEPTGIMAWLGKILPRR